MKLSPLLLVIILLSLVLPVFAQTGGWTKEHQLWPALQLNKKINKKWSLTLDQEFRMEENLKKFTQYFIEPSAVYKPISTLKISGMYRYIYRAHGKVDGQRLSGNIIYTPAWKKTNLEFENRVRYQRDFRKGYAPENTLRYRLMVQYNKKDLMWKPIIGTELFFRFRNTEDNGFSRWRLFAGTEIEFSDMHTLSVIYQAQAERFDKEFFHVYRLTYQLTLPEGKKKEK